MSKHAKDAVSLFRITASPESPLQPREIVIEDAWREGDLIRYTPGWTAERSRPLPDEWVLRELPLVDLDDPDVVTAIIQDHGVISRPLDFMQPLLSPGPDTGDGHDSIWLADIANYLRVTRALLNHWRASSTGHDPSSAWSNEGFNITNAFTAHGFFVTGLDRGVQAFRPHVEVHIDPEVSPGGQTDRTSKSSRKPTKTRDSKLSITVGVDLDLPHVIGAPVTDLFSGMTLQIFNMVVEQLPEKTCANDSCGRQFIRQTGRSEANQRRTTGVKYCSSHCARATAQREYRRREKST